MKLLFFVSEDWYFCSHRLHLALAAKQAGFVVIVITRVQCHGAQIRDAGLRLIPLELSRHSMNPLKELKLIFHLSSIYKTERPDIVHHVALKPILYGSIAAWIAKIPIIVNAMVGLGFLFSSKSIEANIIRPFVVLLFRILLNRQKSHTILQNPDDVRLMCDNGIIDKDKFSLIRGSGVDVLEFSIQAEPTGIPLVVLASRLLWDKGIGEFIEAAYLLKQQGVVVRFALVGEGDSANPSNIPQKQLEYWQNSGIVELWGRREDMVMVFAESRIVCLPSYREGVPKVLIEAASCGRPIVTTDAPGCREIVQDGINGFLVPMRNASAVAEALKKLISSPELCRRMGMRGRELVEKEFSMEKVNAEILTLYERLVH